MTMGIIVLVLLVSGGCVGYIVGNEVGLKRSDRMFDTVGKAYYDYLSEGKTSEANAIFRLWGDLITAALGKINK